MCILQDLFLAAIKSKNPNLLTKMMKYNFTVVHSRRKCAIKTDLQAKQYMEDKNTHILKPQSTMCSLRKHVHPNIIRMAASGTSGQKEWR